MLDIIEISIEEFKKNIYEEYINIFPDEERRRWKSIKNTYDIGIEKFYKITLHNDTIGFFLIEKLSDNHPYYLDYFAIYEKYQSQGYGSYSIKKLIEKIGQENALMAEIEKEDVNNPITIKRLEFYKRLGFKETGAEYLLFNVLYTPIIANLNGAIEKSELDKIFFDYYKVNAGEKRVAKYCKQIK